MRRFALLLATAGGAGYVPVAPGTAGSLLVVPAVPWLALLARDRPTAMALVVAAVVALAVWAAGRAELMLGRHDDGCVVIDEVAGMVAGAALVPPTWGAAALLFVAFRVFDVWKPPPVGFLDRTVDGGLGVVLDDVVAGVYAGVVTRLVMGLV